jgi:Na+/H+ antiporter NhaC
MLHKFWTLLIIFSLLLTFYFVISFGAGKKKNTTISPEIKNYLFNVRILIIFIAVVSVILWLFL